METSPKYRLARCFGVAVFALSAIAAGLAGGAQSATAETAPPTNGRIAFTRYNSATGAHSVVSVAADGSDERVVAESSRYPAFSASTDSIAYCGPEGVTVADIDGTNAEVLGHFACSGLRLAWSPDGTEFAGVTNNSTVSVWSLSGQQTDIVTAAGGVQSVSFSNDGTRLVYVELVWDSPTRFINVINRDGTGLHTIATLNADDRVWWPTFSPDDTKIVYGHEGYIFEMNADGSNSHAVTDRQYGATAVYSPDGQWILFTGLIDGVLGGYKIHPDGSELMRVASTPEGFEDNWHVWQHAIDPPTPTTTTTIAPTTTTTTLPNQAPIPRINLKQFQPHYLLVSAAASTDADGSIVSYQWLWGDGSTPSTTKQAWHQYSRSGWALIRLTVTDDKGASTTRGIWIKIN